MLAKITNNFNNPVAVKKNYLRQLWNNLLQYRSVRGL